MHFEAVQQYAEELVGKRLGNVTKWFPMSMAALRRSMPAADLRDILYTYGTEQIRDSDAIGGEWVRTESMRFRDYLRGLVASGRIGLPHFGDLLEFETTRQQMSHDPLLSRAGRSAEQAKNDAERLFGKDRRQHARPLLASHAQLRDFSCNVLALIKRVEGEAAGPAALPHEPTCVLFIRKPGTAKVIVQTVNGPLREMLTRCDGMSTTMQILDGTAARYARPGGPDEEAVRAECLAALEHCHTSGILVAADASTETPVVTP
jgi:hypothetical protein